MTTLFDSGNMALRQGQFEVALAHLGEAVRRVPSDHRSRLGAARALAELGERERALLVLNQAAEGLLRRNYLLSAMMAVKLALRFNPAEKLLKQTLARIHAQALATAPSRQAAPPPVPPAPLTDGTVPGDLSALRGGELVEKAMEVLLTDDDGPPADLSKRPPLPLFADLESEAFVDLVERISLREFTEGQRVVREGEPGDSVFVIVSGRMRVMKESEPPKQLATLQGGALFGELALLTGAPRSASVYAAADVEVFEISRDDLDYVSRTHPSVPKALAEFAQRRLAMNLLATAPLFTQLETGHRGPVLHRFRGRLVPAGERVVAEGTPSPGLFLVLSGEFSVEKKNADGEPTLIKLLKDGDVFGEMSLVSGASATATVGAIRKSAVAFLAREAYEELVQSYPQVEDFLIQLSQQRLAANAAVVQPAEAIDAEELIESA
jgi:CRP-like cAMP-binding protein